MNTNRLSIAAALLFFGAATILSNGLPIGLADAHAARAKAAPRSVKTATKLIRQSATQLTKDYAKGRALNVCTGLTAKARKSLGGGVGCVTTVKRVAKLKPIKKISIKKIVLRRNRAWADVSGYLNGNPKKRLAVAFKWEGGRYRLDHSLSTLAGLFGR